MAISHPLLQSLPASVTLDSVRQLESALVAREKLLRQVCASFERKYGGTLEDLNQRLQARKAPEHPAWEHSIEWGNARDQLAQLELTHNIVTWLINSLTRSKSS